MEPLTICQAAVGVRCGLDAPGPHALPQLSSLPGVPRRGRRTGWQRCTPGREGGMGGSEGGKGGKEGGREG